MKPKRYIVFMFDSSPGYSPIGGWNDMKVMFDTLDELGDYFTEYTTNPKSWRFDVIEVLDLETGKVVDISPPKPEPKKPEPSLFGFDDEFPWDDDPEFDAIVGRPRLPLPGVVKRRKKKGRKSRWS